MRVTEILRESKDFFPEIDGKFSLKIANSKYDPIDSGLSEMSGRTAECWHTGHISTKSGKSLMNAFLRARTAFGFEYLISIRAEHNDADRHITGIEGLLFRD